MSNGNEFACKICGSIRDNARTLEIHHKVVHDTSTDWRSLTVYTKTTPIATPAVLYDRREDEILQQQLEAIEAEEAVQAAIRANFEEFARKRQ